MENTMIANSDECFAVSRNPASGEVIGLYKYDTEAHVEAALARASVAARAWREVPIAQRVSAIEKLSTVLRKRQRELATVITNEMGKPIAQALGEVEKCATLCDWYVEHGPSMLEPLATQVENNQARQEFRPLGTILGVMPWNFPIWQVLRGAVGMYLAGNTYVLKHAPNVMRSAYLLSDVLTEAGFPEGTFEVLNVPTEVVASIISDDRIAAITVTGSVRAGSAIARLAGAAIKKCVLELGGSDAFIVLADANIEEAVKSAVIGRFQNSGQVCLAAKRIIVEQPIAEDFENRFVKAVKELRLGDPLAEDTFVGPMARYDLRDELHGQVERSLEEGARLVCGGHKVVGKGNFYTPTILADVNESMTAFKEEMFGPVACLITARDVNHAIELANNSEFGLGGTVWTSNVDLANAIAAKLETGAVFINGNVASDPRVTVGGVKKSGYGRELSSFGVHEFCNIQTVWVGRR